MRRFARTTFIVTMVCIAIGTVALFTGVSPPAPAFTFMGGVATAYMTKRWAEKRTNGRVQDG